MCFVVNCPRNTAVLSVLYNRETVVHIALYNKVALGVCTPHDQICPNKATDCSLGAAILGTSDWKQV